MGVKKNDRERNSLRKVRLRYLGFAAYTNNFYSQDGQFLVEKPDPNSGLMIQPCLPLAVGLTGYELE